MSRAEGNGAWHRFCLPPGHGQAEDASGVRFLLQPHGRPVALAGWLARPNLPRRGDVRGRRPACRARPAGHDLLRRRHRRARHLARFTGWRRRMGHQLAAAGFEPDHGRHVPGHEACRLWPDLLLHLHASLLHRPADELAGPCDRGPHRDEPRHVHAPFGRGEFRLRRIDGARRALRPDGRVRRRVPQTVGRDRGGRDAVGPRHRPRRRPGEGAPYESPWPLLQRGGAAEHAAVAPGPPGADPGGRFAPWDSCVGLCGGPCVRRRHGARRPGETAPRARSGVDRTRP